MFRLFACGVAFAALAACAPAPGQNDAPAITATDSCVLIVFGGSNTGGTATASPTTTLKLPLPAAAGDLLVAEPDKPSGQSCTVSVTNATSPNGAVSVGRNN